MSSESHICIVSRPQSNVTFAYGIVSLYIAYNIVMASHRRANHRASAHGGIAVIPGGRAARRRLPRVPGASIGRAGGERGSDRRS